MPRQYRNYTNKDIAKAIKANLSWRSTSLKLGLKGSGSSIKNLKKIAIENDFDFSHFKGQKIHLGTISKNYVPAKNFLKKGTNISSANLKDKLFREELLENICSVCGQLPVWNGKPLVLELDHIDGDTTNNELSNLRILCCHCHSQTITYKGRNVKKKIKGTKRVNNCKKCGKNINQKSKHHMCRSCFNKTRYYDPDNRKVKNRPNKTVLQKEIDNLGYTGVGNKYDVSDVTIRNWAKKYKLID